MEKVISFFREAAGKASEFFLEVVKATAETTTKLLAKASGKAAQFTGGQVKKFVSSNKQALLLAATIISAAAAIVSGVCFLLERKK